MQKKSSLYRLILTAILLALGIVLPFLTGQIPTVGQAISPLHIPAFICGLTCGPVWGAALGFILPLLRSVLFGMPPLVNVAVPMAFELAVYGLVCGLAYPALRKVIHRGGSLVPMVAALLIAMLAGRIVGGAAKAVVMGMAGKPYPFSALIAGYFTGTAVGALIHMVIVPVIVAALEKAKLSPLAQDGK